MKKYWVLLLALSFSSPAFGGWVCTISEYNNMKAIMDRCYYALRDFGPVADRVPQEYAEVVRQCRWAVDTYGPYIRECERQFGYR